MPVVVDGNPRATVVPTFRRLLLYPCKQGIEKLEEKSLPWSSEVDAALSAILAGAVPSSLESETLEFKSQGRSAKDAEVLLAEAASCLANASGGTLVVGVHDKKSGPTAIEGCTIDGRHLQRRIFELTNPPLVTAVDSLAVGDASILVVTVPSSPDVHLVQGRATERIGTSCEPMAASRIAQVLSERRNEDWSAGDSGVRVDHVSARAMQEARALLSALPDPARRAWAEEPDLDLLRRLGVVTSLGTLNRAGELLFVGRTGVLEELVYVYRRTVSGQLSVNEHLEGPMLPAIVRVLEMIGARLDRTPVNIPHGQQLQIADLPDAAVREAVVNALMHRDYNQPHPVFVEHAPTNFTVSSPGPFIQGITAENLLTTSPRTRNPALANAIRALGLGEAAGVGVDRMYAEMARVGHRPPAFTADQHQVRVVLLGGAPNQYVTRYLATLPSLRAVDPNTPLVLLQLLNKRTTTAAELAPLVQRSEDETAGILEGLCAEPVVMLERTRQSARYARGVYRLREHVISALGPAVTYQRRTVDQTDRKIIELVRESGQINSKMVQIMLDLRTAATSRLLADLVTRGVLVKTSEAQRGMSVTYGPGPQFPKPPRRRRTSTKEQR